MEKKSNIPFKEYLKISLWSLKVTWGISPFAAIVILSTEIIRNLRGIVNTYIIARLIDRLISLASNDGTKVLDILPFLVIILVVNILFTGIDELRNYASRIVRRLSQPYLEKMSFEKVNFLGVQTLELPDVANAKQKMQDWLYSIMDVGNNVVRIIAAFVKTLVAGVVLLKTIPLIIPLIFLTTVVFYLQRRYFFKKEFDWQTNDKHLIERRRNYWIAGRLSDSTSIGEVSITGAYNYLSSKFVAFFQYYNGGLIKIMKKDSISSFLISILSNFVMIVGYVQVFQLLLLKKITIGETTFYMSTISNFYDGIEWFFSEIVAYRDLVMKMKEVYEFFGLKPAIEDGKEPLERFVTPPVIEVKNISFHYPNSKRNIFKNFSLKIEAGEKLAIVGENGAGKTTLVKLLSRIYDPQEGEILINGINLKDIKINDWYKNLGVLFQEYNFYGELTAEENIYMGKSMKDMNRKKLIEASKNADAHDFIRKYENGYKTVMSERFRGGIRPSTGQRQKIAIARFFYRNAPVAIFDEPTSAIDAESEYRIFNRIYNFFKNKSVLIISHRFSTVRNADRIIVIHEGKIVEEGSHQELLKMNKRYANAFKKQAEGYL